jgi:hypothetical protein
MTQAALLKMLYAAFTPFRRFATRGGRTFTRHSCPIGCALICWRFLRVDWVAGRS